MSNKKYLLDNSVNSVSDLVSDEQMHAAFENTNFGCTDFRGLISQGSIKALAGWHQGHTLTCILVELGLINWNRQTDKIKVTAKGKHYIWLSFRNTPRV